MYNSSKDVRQFTLDNEIQPLFWNKENIAKIKEMEVV